jgi:hypothetical protein
MYSTSEIALAEFTENQTRLSDEPRENESSHSILRKS